MKFENIYRVRQDDGSIAFMMSYSQQNGERRILRVTSKDASLSCVAKALAELGSKCGQVLAIPNDRNSVSSVVANTVTIRGNLNPVLCAMDYLEAQPHGLEIDRSTFRSVAKAVGDIRMDHGIVIGGPEKLGYLCRVGNFTIRLKNGKLIAKLK